MPIYEYTCTNCKNTQEERHSMSSKPEITCDKCGKPCKKMVSAPPVHYKCDGFYCTDNKGD